MASNLKYPTTLRNNQLDEITALAGTSALLRIYDGTQPANANTAIGAQVLLAELVCDATAFAAAASSGALTANAISNDASANASGTASWFRLVASNGTTVVMDGSVGTTGSDLNLNSVSITSGQTVSVSSFVITGGNA
jgi:hypothetical protein